MFIATTRHSKPATLDEWRELLTAVGGGDAEAGVSGGGDGGMGASPVPPNPARFFERRGSRARLLSQPSGDTAETAGETDHKRQSFACLPRAGVFMREITVYQDDATLFVVGRPAAEGADGFGGEGATPRQGGVTYRMIKFERTTGGGEIVDTSLTTVYSFHDVLRELNSGTRGTWRKVLDAAAWLGGIRLLKGGLFLLFATEAQEVGAIGAHMVRAVTATAWVPVAAEDPAAAKRAAWLPAFAGRLLLDAASKEEAKYIALLEHEDLVRDCYFSYTLDLTRPLQQTLVVHPPTAPGTASASGCQHGPLNPPNDAVTWNHFLRSELRSVGVNGQWLVPIIHGSFQQRTLTKFCTKSLTLTLIGRRSRHFAGTRYLKRGVSAAGWVANDVEVEQVLDDHHGGFAAYVQVRGSVPVYWMQQTSATIPKPPIELTAEDVTYAAARKHFENLFSRYGGPLLVMSLVKKFEKNARETIIGREFADAVRFTNYFLPPSQRIQFLALDYSALSKTKSHFPALRDAAFWAAVNTGFFCNRISELPDILPPPDPAGGAGTDSSRRDSFTGKPNRADDSDGSGSDGTEWELKPNLPYLAALARAQHAPFFVPTADDGLGDALDLSVTTDADGASRRRHSSRLPPPDPNLQPYCAEVPSVVPADGAVRPASRAIARLRGTTKDIDSPRPGLRKASSFGLGSPGALLSPGGGDASPAHSAGGRMPKAAPFGFHRRTSRRALHGGGKLTELHGHAFDDPDEAARGAAAGVCIVAGAWSHLRQGLHSRHGLKGDKGLMGGLIFDRARARAEEGVASRLWEWNRIGGPPRYTFVDLFGRYRCAVAAKAASARNGAGQPVANVHAERCSIHADESVHISGADVPVDVASAAARSALRGRLRTASSDSGTNHSPADAMLSSTAIGGGAAAAASPALQHESAGSAPPASVPTVLRQRGVLRVNCVDCLDRTNVGHFMVGCYMLGYQLHALGAADSPVLEQTDKAAMVLMLMFEELGDRIAMQYAGSGAHKKVSKQDRGAGASAPAAGGGGGGGGKGAFPGGELTTSIKRYYSNSFRDQVKQDAMNLFLGVYRPWRDKGSLFEIEGDGELHNRAVTIALAAEFRATMPALAAARDRRAALRKSRKVITGGALSTGPVDTASGSDVRGGGGGGGGGHETTPSDAPKTSETAEPAGAGAGGSDGSADAVDISTAVGVDKVVATLAAASDVAVASSRTAEENALLGAAAVAVDTTTPAAKTGLSALLAYSGPVIATGHEPSSPWWSAAIAEFDRRSYGQEVQAQGPPQRALSTVDEATEDGGGAAVLIGRSVPARRGVAAASSATGDGMRMAIGGGAWLEATYRRWQQTFFDVLLQTTHMQPVGIMANIVAPVHRPLPMPTQRPKPRRRTTVTTPAPARGMPAVAPWLANADGTQSGARTPLAVSQNASGVCPLCGGDGSACSKCGAGGGIMDLARTFWRGSTAEVPAHAQGSDDIAAQVSPSGGGNVVIDERWQYYSTYATKGTTQAVRTSETEKVVFDEYLAELHVPVDDMEANAAWQRACGLTRKLRAGPRFGRKGKAVYTLSEELDGLRRTRPVAHLVKAQLDKYVPEAVAAFGAYLSCDYMTAPTAHMPLLRRTRGGSNSSSDTSASGSRDESDTE